jgi:hypothetical protein
MIVFSILIHENPNFVKFQIENFFKYVNCAIIVHINLEYKDIFRDIDFGPKVFINPVSHKVAWSAYGLVEGHIENFMFARRELSFDHFCLQASNVLFYRKGANEYIVNNGNGLQKVNIVAPPNPGWWQADSCYGDPILTEMLVKNNWLARYGGRVEGSFFETSKFAQMADIIQRDYLPAQNMAYHYAKEEFLFPTAFHNLFPDVKIGNAITGYDGHVEYTQNILDHGHEHIFSTKLDHFTGRTFEDPTVELIKNLP